MLNRLLSFIIDLLSWLSHKGAAEEPNLFGKHGKSNSSSFGARVMKFCVLTKKNVVIQDLERYR